MLLKFLMRHDGNEYRYWWPRIWCLLREVVRLQRYCHTHKWCHAVLPSIPRRWLYGQKGQYHKYPRLRSYLQRNCGLYFSFLHIRVLVLNWILLRYQGLDFNWQHLQRHHYGLQKQFSLPHWEPVLHIQLILFFCERLLIHGDVLRSRQPQRLVCRFQRCFQLHHSFFLRYDCLFPLLMV